MLNEVAEAGVPSEDGEVMDEERYLRGLPRTEHPPQPAGGLRRRIIGAVGTTRRRSARRRTGCGCSTPAAHDAQDSRWLQDSGARQVDRTIVHMW